MKLQRERIGAIAGKLRGMPPSTSVDQLTKQAAIAELAEEIKQLQARGYSMSEIASTLTSEGLVIAPATLKNYLQRARAGAAKRAGMKRVATATATRRVARPQRPEQHAKRARSAAATAPAMQEQQSGSGNSTFTPTEDSKDI